MIFDHYEDGAEYVDEIRGRGLKFSEKTRKEIRGVAKALNTHPRALIEKIWKNWKQQYDERVSIRPIGPEEYRVIEALIAHEYKPGNAFYLNLLMDNFLEYYALDPEVSEQQSYLNANRQPLPLMIPEALNLKGLKPHPVQLETFHGEPWILYERIQSELESFLLDEPVLKGAITLSRPGINQNQNRALISFQKARNNKNRYHDVSLQEQAALLEKNQNEAWQVVWVKKIGEAFQPKMEF